MHHATIITPYGVATVGENSCSVHADNGELYAWAHRPGNAWPCSDLAELNYCTAYFDSNGLYDLAANATEEDYEVTGDELSAWTSDVLALALAESHPCWLVCVGQFRSSEVSP